MPRSGGRGSTGSTPRATRARSSAATPNGTTSRPRPAAAREALLRARWIADDGAAGTGLRQSRRRHAGGEARRAAAADRCRALHAGGRDAPALGRADRARPRRCCRRAKRPVILAGRGSRSEEAWNARVALAEALGARVVTDLKVGAASRPIIRCMPARPASMPAPDSAPGHRAMPTSS